MGLFTFIYNSAAFLIRHLKISRVPLTSDPDVLSLLRAPFLQAWSDSLYMFASFQLISLFSPSYQMKITDTERPGEL